MRLIDRVNADGRFYLNIAIHNFAYVRFIKDSIAWKETPCWSDHPTQLELASVTRTGRERAENVARTMQLLGEYETVWLRERVREGDPALYGALFTDGSGASLIIPIAEKMLARVERFEGVDVSRAVTILRETGSQLRRAARYTESAGS